MVCTSVPAREAVDLECLACGILEGVYPVENAGNLLKVDEAAVWLGAGLGDLRPK
jgi:hypothetical protein